MNELQIQSDIWRRLWASRPQARRLLFHVANEETYKNAQQASSGVIPGTPDLFFIWSGNFIPIELKDEKGQCSKIQKVIHALYARQGATTFLFRDSDTAVAFLECVVDSGLAVAQFEYAYCISPYAKSDKYEEYLNDWQTARKDKKKK